LNGGRSLVDHLDDRDLVRHRDERAGEIGKAADLGKGAREIFAPHAERHDGGVDPMLLEPRIIDHRRLERRRRIADVRDDLRVAVQHSDQVPL
jgi:hypothetical protein